MNTYITNRFYANRYLYPVLFWYAVLFTFFIDLPFFNDTILFSRIAHWFYNNNFSSFILPENLDTGNQPFFCAYIALLWKLFGRTLIVSHLAMLPFVLGIVIQYYKLAARFLNSSLLPYAMLLLAIEPTLMSQNTQVSIDIPLVFFYLLGINSILNNKRGWLVLALIGLSFTNLRGIMGIVWLFTTDVLLNLHVSLPPLKGLGRYFSAIIKNIGSFAKYYIPATLIVIAWFYYHQTHTGWALMQPNEWHEHRQLQNLSGIIRNMAFIAWRFFDFGKIAFWLFLFGGLIITRLKKQKMNREPFQLWIIILCPLIGYTVCFIPFSNPIGHRYFMVVNLLLLIPVAAQFVHLKTFVARIFVVLVFCISLLTAQLYVYPQRFANGWDSTITYTRYFKLRDEMRDYILSRHINQDDVAAGFPCNAAYLYTNLDSSKVEYKNKYFGGTGVYKYVIQSNINNDFKIQQLEDLQQHWVLEKEFTAYPLYIRLYRHTGQ